MTPPPASDVLSDFRELIDDKDGPAIHILDGDVETGPRVVYIVRDDDELHTFAVEEDGRIALAYVALVALVPAVGRLRVVGLDEAREKGMQWELTRADARRAILGDWGPIDLFEHAAETGIEVEGEPE